MFISISFFLKKSQVTIEVFLQTNKYMNVERRKVVKVVIVMEFERFGGGEWTSVLQRSFLPSLKRASGSYSVWLLILYGFYLDFQQVYFNRGYGDKSDLCGDNPKHNYRGWRCRCLFAL